MMVKETNVKIPEEPVPPEGQFNLDGILGELGSFGKYQLLLLLLLAFRDSFLNMCNFNYVFTAAEVNFRCYVPECESQDSPFNVSWRAFALTNDSKTCVRRAPYVHPAHSGREERPWAQDTCAPASFDPNVTVSCHKLVYEDYNSIAAEFDLGCQPWKRTLIGTVHNLGLIFSFVLSGVISDRYGRKVVIVVTPLVVGSVGLAKSFSINYWMLLALEFLETALGYGNASMVLSLETVSHQQRVVFSCMSDILASFGTAFFGLIAWKIPYWRSMMRAIYAPLLIAVFYIFLVDEGVRWLLAHNKKDEAVRVLNKVAKVNNITLSNKAKAMLTKMTERNKADKEGALAPADAPQLLRVLRSRTILCRVALMAACFFCAIFVYNGTIINSTSISGNKYVNFSALLLVSVTARVVTALTLDRFGRKRSICVAYTLCACFFIASAFVPKLPVANVVNPEENDSVIIEATSTQVPVANVVNPKENCPIIIEAISVPDLTELDQDIIPEAVKDQDSLLQVIYQHLEAVWWSSVLLYLAGKMCSSYGLFSVYVVAMEVFPTTSRNSLTNIANTVGRLGSVVAPQAPLLDNYMSGLPSVLFGVVALGPALLALLLPDTSRTALPDDVAAAESIDRPPENDAQIAKAKEAQMTEKEAQITETKEEPMTKAKEAQIMEKEVQMAETKEQTKIPNIKVEQKEKKQTQVKA